MTTVKLRIGGAWRTLSASAVASAPPPPVVVPPGAPVGFDVRAGDTQATATWGLPSTGGAAFLPGTLVVKRVSDNATVQTISVPAGATSWTVTSLTNGTAYLFSLTLANVAGSGPAATFTQTPQTPTQYNALTRDWAAITSVQNYAAIPGSRIFYGDVLLPAGADYWQDPSGAQHAYDSGSGTPGDPYVLDGVIVRDDPAQNALGTAVTNKGSSRLAKLYVKRSNVVVRNFDAPYVNVPRLNPLPPTGVLLEHGHAGPYDYVQPTAPTVDKFTGGAIASTAFRQFWHNTTTRASYFINPGGTWTKGNEWPRLIGATAPASPVLNDVWVEAKSNATPLNSVIAYWRWNGSAWVNIDAEIDTHLAGPNDGASYACVYAHVYDATGWGIEVRFCDLTAWEDIFYCSSTPSYSGPLPKGYKIHDNLLRHRPSRFRYQPHGDGLQTTGGSKFYLQRNRIETGWVAGGSEAWRMSSICLFKTDQAAIDDILFSENWVDQAQNKVQLRRPSSAPATRVPTNARIRNNIAPPGVLAQTTPDAVTYKISDNRDIVGNALPANAYQAGATSDGDPTREGYSVVA